MKIIWWLLWLLMIIQLIAIPFWPKLVRLVIHKKPQRKILDWLLTFSICGFALIMLAASFIPFASISLIIARDSMLTGKKEPLSEYFDYPNRKFADIRGQIHVHCYLSHDSTGKLDEIAEAARKNGVRWVILTDHIEELPDGNYPDIINGVLFVYGSEQDAGDPTRWGPAQDRDEETCWLRASLKDASVTLNMHGHIEGFGKDGKTYWRTWDAIEIVNFHSNLTENKLGLLISALFNPEDLYNNVTGLMPKNFEYWQELAARTGKPIPIFSATDAHQRRKILGVQVDPYELILGLSSTHIWVERGKELNQEVIFDAIKKGRTYVGFEYLGDPTGFQFHAETMTDKCMTGEAMMAPKYLSVSAPGEGNSTRIKFYRDNILVGESSGCSAYVPNPDPGYWRVEVWKNDRPWIISGQILVF